MIQACLLNSHRWLHARLTEDAAPSDAACWTTDPAAADVVIYPVPPWHDPDAPQRHFAARPDLWSRTFLFSQDDDPVVWAPGVFTSITSNHRDVQRARGGCYVYHTHYEPDQAAALQPRPAVDAKYLWTFVGSVDTRPAVRVPLINIHDERALVMDTALWNRQHRWQFDGPGSAERRRAITAYADTLHQAKFIVCPRGTGPSSVRLFEAMRVGRCPVIVSDQWLAPPFVDWESCAIRVAERDLRHIPAVLREREQEAAELGLRARAVWEQRYSPECALSTLLEACLDIDPLQRRTAARAPMLARAATTLSAARRLKLAVKRTIGR